MANLKRNLQNDIYENMDKFLEDIELLKSKYLEQGPIFTGRTEIFAEVAQTLIAKAADFLTITSRKESDINVKKLRERLEEIEKEKQELKQELINEKRLLE